MSCYKVLEQLEDSLSDHSGLQAISYANVNFMTDHSIIARQPEQLSLIPTDFKKGDDEKQQT